MCFTEKQKQEIARLNMSVVEFKRLLIRLGKALAEVFSELTKKILNAVHTIHVNYSNMPPKEKYKMVRRLGKTGFTPKEINLMIGRTYHCRNNC